MTLTLHNTNTVSANRVVVNGTALSDLYATKTYVDNEMKYQTLMLVVEVV